MAHVVPARPRNARSRVERVLGAGRGVLVALVATLVLAGCFAQPAESDAAKQIFSDPDKFVSAAPFLFMLTAIIVFVFGPGVFSLDWLIGRKFRRKDTAG